MSTDGLLAKRERERERARERERKKIFHCNVIFEPHAPHISIKFASKPTRINVYILEA